MAVEFILGGLERFNLDFEILIQQVWQFGTSTNFKCGMISNYMDTLNAPHIMLFLNG